jgi:hypothetical protein
MSPHSAPVIGRIDTHSSGCAQYFVLLKPAPNHKHQLSADSSSAACATELFDSGDTGTGGEEEEDTSGSSAALLVPSAPSVFPLLAPQPPQESTQNPAYVHVSQKSSSQVMWPLLICVSQAPGPWKSSYGFVQTGVGSSFSLQNSQLRSHRPAKSQLVQKWLAQL